MGSGESAVVVAVAALGAALDGLVGVVGAGGLEQLDDAGLVEVLQGFERLRNRMPVVDHGLAVAGRGLVERYGQGRVPRFLAQVLQISAGEAAWRVRAAEQLGPRRSMLGRCSQRCGRCWPAPRMTGR